MVEPSAMRMPISRVFWATMLATREKIPTVLSISASPAIVPSSMTSMRCMANVFACTSCMR
jgi:hypothetical protein